MAIPNIPGVSFEYKDDGRLIATPMGPITDSVLIIGNAIDGPINTPVRVNSKNVEQIFGSVVYDSVYKSSAAGANGDPNAGKYSGNNLVKAYAEVMQGGCTDVMLMRIGDSTHSVSATATLASGNDYIVPVGATAGTGQVDSALGIALTARFPGSVYNGVGLHASWKGAAGGATEITLELRQDLKAKGRSFTWTLNNGKGTTMSKRDLINMINTDPRNGAILASSVDNDMTLDNAMALDSKIASGDLYWVFDKGTDGTRKEFGTAADIYVALMGSTNATATGIPDEDSPLAKLETIEADVVLMAALYADENVGSQAAPKSIVRPLAEALHASSKNDYPMVGVIGVRPAIDSVPAKVGAVVTKLTTAYAPNTVSAALVANTNNTLLNMGYFVSKDAASNGTSMSYLDPDSGKNVNLGKYIICVAGPDVLLSNPKLGQYVDTGAGVFAGLLTIVPSDRAVTNMKLPGVSDLSYVFTNKQLSKISGGQPFNTVTGDSGMGGSYVAFRKNINGDIVVNLDNTCAPRDSDYASYQIVDVVNTVAAGIKKVCEPFIGMSAQTTTRSALENQIRKFLDYCGENKLIAGGENTGYRFAVTASGLDQLLGRINVDLELRPALQIKMIAVAISVAPPTGA